MRLAALLAAMMLAVPHASADTIPLEKDGGNYLVPVLINNALTLKFVLDTGASDVAIPSDVVST
jgi:predicted aspartyl protease